MHEVSGDLCNMKQQENEVEKSYHKIVNNAIPRCGNDHGEDKKITLYNDGLSATTRTIATRHRGKISRTDVTLKEIENVYWLEDEAVRARVRQTA